MHDQAAKLRELVQKKVFPPAAPKTERNARVIAVTSGKGGVGKSNITVNLALALSRLGLRVLIIDVDFGMANVDLLLGCKPVYNFSHLLNRSCSIAEIIAQGPEGIRYISGGSGIQDLADLSATERLAISAQLAKLDDDADLILLDTGAGIAQNVLHFVLCADDVIVVTTPEPTAVTDAYAIVKAATAQYKQAHMHLIINRAHDAGEARHTALNLQRVCEKFLAVHLTDLGFIPEDTSVGRAVRRQQPFYLLYPTARASYCINEIAGALLDRESGRRTQGFKGFFHRFMERFL